MYNIDTSGFVLKTKYGTDKAELENEISLTKGLFKKIDYNTKNPEIKGKRTPIIGLATNAALTAVENKIPDFSCLVKKKTDYHAKFTEIENKLTDHNNDKYITTSEFNKLTVENFAARLNEANFVTKTSFDDKLKSLNQNITSNKTKH